MPPLEGIIYPPAEVRNIVDKTASFVARNGPEFEMRIKQNEINNPKFNFLSPGDPYHAYYRHRVEVIKEGKDEQQQQPVTTLKPPVPKEIEKTSTTPTPASMKTPSAVPDATKHRQSALLKEALQKSQQLPPTKPPADFEFMADPPSISALDLDVVKLTAQFVARNGRQFLTNLMTREQRNPQFDFLRPQHSLFQYFTKLLEQYTKVLIPPKDLMSRLSLETSEKSLTEDVDYRVRWLKHERDQKRREEEEQERERISYAQIDWHGFVVVETVDYQPWETGNFPPPTTAQEVGARVLMQRRAETEPAPPPQRPKGRAEHQDSNTQVEDMEEASSSDEEEELDNDTPSLQTNQPNKSLSSVDAAPVVQQPLNLPTPGNVEVRAYDPKKEKSAAKVERKSEEFLVSPITGERIPASKVAEHMRIGLLDPRWVEERDKQITARATGDIVYAPGDTIESSLKNLAERRTDIFGVGEEAAQEKAIGTARDEDERAKTLWETMQQEHPEQNKEDDALNRGNKGNDETTAIKSTTQHGLPPQPTLSAQPPAPAQSSMRSQPTLPTPPQTPVVPVLTSQPSMPPQPPAPQPSLPALPPVPSVPPVVLPPRPSGLAPAPPLLLPPGQYLPPGPGGPTPGGFPPGVMLPPSTDMDDDAPMSKRPRGEDHLVPEQDWLAMNVNPVNFQVSVPIWTDKTEWRLNGQVLNLRLSLTETVAAIKALVHNETGMPPSKQKLQLDSLFLKDANSLAYYNFRQGTTVGLQIKERGGRKK